MPNVYDEGEITEVAGTEEFVFNQTMLRVKNPEVSLQFYCGLLGMTLVKKMDFKNMEFSLYFVGYIRPDDGPIPVESKERTAYAFRQKGLLELTHNWGTEVDSNFTGYHSGNDDPRGFGHIGISVPNVESACQVFASANVNFVKRPNEGSMPGLAFIQYPDGYWIEILNADSLAELVEQ